MQELDTNQLSITVDESLNDMMSMSFYNAQSYIQSFLSNVIEKIILILLHKDVSIEMMDAHVPKFLDIGVAAKGLLKRL